MIFITGPRFSGKREYAEQLLSGDGRAEYEVQDRAAATPMEQLPALADEMVERFSVVTASEMGCGVVPVSPEDRLAREKAGRFACLLAERAAAVIRMCCGIPTVLKGQLPGPGEAFQQKEELRK